MAINTDKFKSCTNCNGKMNHLGIIPFRIGGSDGFTMFFFGDTAELGERKADLDVFRCESCSKVDLYDNRDSLPDNEFDVE